MMRALVTGGAGFLGSHIADALTRVGVHVTILDRRPAPYASREQRVIVGDILDRAAVLDATRNVDAVYHLAGFADLNRARSRPLESAQLNLLGTLNCLEAARAVGVKRFLFASTVYVYSREGGFYRCSKQACEAYIEEYQRQFGLDYTILRYGSLYGPRADESNGVYRLLKEAVTTGRIAHTGHPDDAREYVHVEDAARLSVEALAEPYANEHVVITGHHPTRIRDLFTMFSEILARDLTIDYLDDAGKGETGHYRVTPYAYTPRAGRKLTSNYYVDMGQGILQLLEELNDNGVSGPPRDGRAELVTP